MAEETIEDARGGWRSFVTGLTNLLLVLEAPFPIVLLDELLWPVPFPDWAGAMVAAGAQELVRGARVGHAPLPVAAPIGAPIGRELFAMVPLGVVGLSVRGIGLRLEQLRNATELIRLKAKVDCNEEN